MTQDFDLIVACDLERGIGINNQIPWRLPGDMKYFRTVTSSADSGSNAVIMGRKTWQSIPAKFRPLPQRLNIVLTRNAQFDLPDGVLRCETLDDALDLCARESVTRAFVIGGAQIYALALSHPSADKLYLTQVLSKFPCDVFFPFYEDRFRLLSESATQEENSVEYRFKVYERQR